MLGKVFWSGAAAALASSTPLRWSVRCTRSSAKASFGASVAPPSAAKMSSRFATCSCAMSRTVRSRVRPCQKHVRRRRLDRRASVVPTTMPSTSRITTAPRSSSRRAAGSVDDGVRDRRARRIRARRRSRAHGSAPFPRRNASTPKRSSFRPAMSTGRSCSSRTRERGSTPKVTARVCSRRATRSKRSADSIAAAEAAALAAHAAWRAGRSAEAHEILTRAVASLEGRDPSPGMAAVLAEKARLDAFGGPAGRRGAKRARMRSGSRSSSSSTSCKRMCSARSASSHAPRGPPAGQSAPRGGAEPTTSSSERVRALTNIAVLWRQRRIHGARRPATARLANEMPRRIGRQDDAVLGRDG